MKSVFLLFLTLVVATVVELSGSVAADGPGVSADVKPIWVGWRRELFLDDYLIDKLDSAEITYHRPERKSVAMEFDRPWENGGEGYAAIMKVDGKYNAYYRSWGFEDDDPMKYCMLQSQDGIHWTRPSLGLCEFHGIRSNNIMLDKLPGTPYDTQDFTPFEDERPDCPPEERFKAVGNGYRSDPPGLFAWKSADGVHWFLMQTEPICTDGKFDTQNIAFWSTVEKKYVLYYRAFVNDVRVVLRATSDDFIHWTPEGEIQFPKGGGPTLREQFYTNQIQQYHRAPHIYIGLPARYVDNGLIPATKNLPEWELRQYRMGIFKGGERLGTATTDTILIWSRDGVNFQRADDVFIAPGLRTSRNWFYGDTYTAWNIVETPSEDDDSPNELSIYIMEGTNSDKPSRLRRFALRIDGFGSLHAKAREGKVLTKPVIFEGNELSLNFSTSSAGYVKVEVLDADGQVVPGFSAEDCDLLFGDSIDQRVSWKGSADFSRFSGKPIRLRFVMSEADVYSIKCEQ